MRFPVSRSRARSRSPSRTYRGMAGGKWSEVAGLSFADNIAQWSTQSSSSPRPSVFLILPSHQRSSIAIVNHQLLTCIRCQRCHDELGGHTMNFIPPASFDDAPPVKYVPKAGKHADSISSPKIRKKKSLATLWRKSTCNLLCTTLTI